MNGAVSAVADLLYNAPTPSLLIQRLKAVAGLEHVKTYRPHGGQRELLGLRLKTSDEKWQEAEQ
jgi:hypothetical protein